ncbi:MAG: HlyD family efflux transporter periplasmic adaptor subunit [Bdellovibrio sp.]|nr:HlyD family efflux transporter periplasmic adaptor subunit [Bdellovibrio sp.]
MKHVLLLTFMSVTNLAFAASSDSAKPVDHPKVLLEEIKTLDDKKRIIVPVKVEAKIQSLVSADIEGHVTKILKPLGSTVKAGETILFLENKDPGFTYAAVPVRSPVAGVVSQIWTSQMAKVSRGDKLFTVINPKTLKLSAEFPSSDLYSVSSGLTGEFKVDSSRDLKLAIRVVGVSPLVDARTGTASAELEFTDTQAILPQIGTIGQATFEINQGSIIMIPEASLVFQDGKPMVRVLKGKNEFSKKAVVLGEQRDSSYVVKSGVAMGEKIVVRSSRPLKEGDVLDIEANKTEKTQ